MKNKSEILVSCLPPPPQDPIYTLLNSDIMETQSAARKRGQDIKYHIKWFSMTMGLSHTKIHTTYTFKYLEKGNIWPPFGLKGF